jgi:transcriptional regulator with XRE-family HTH domain
MRRIGGTTMGDTREPEDDSMAHKLDYLFRTVRPPGRQGEYSYQEVAEGIRDLGIAISHTYVWQLRRGARANPTKRHLEGLAAFFGVPVSYFFDDAVANQIESELGLVRALRDSNVRSVALRIADLTPASVDTVKEIVDRIRQIEGLPDDPASDRHPPG